MQRVRSVMALFIGALTLAACGGGDAYSTLLNQTIDGTPTIAVQSDGQTLEQDLRQVVKGNLTLIRELVTFDDEADYDVSLEWSINEEASAYFVFREATLVTNPEATLANQISISIYTMSVLQPAFGEPSIDATLTLVASMDANNRTYTTSRDFLLTVDAEEVDSSTIPLIPLSTNFTRNNDEALTYVDETLQNAPRSARNAAMVRVRGFVSGIMTDWNTAFITSGEYGMALYRPDVDFRDAFAIGDFIEVTGEAATFGGSRQISWMTNIKLAPATDPEISIRQLTASQFSSVSVANSAQRNRDGSMVRLANLQFETITSGALPIGASNHLSIRMKVIDGDNSYTVNMYMNYHVGQAKRQAMYDLFSQATLGSDTFVTYEGIMGWNFGPQLLPLEVDNFILQ